MGCVGPIGTVVRRISIFEKSRSENFSNHCRLAGLRVVHRDRGVGGVDKQVRKIIRHDGVDVALRDRNRKSRIRPEPPPVVLVVGVRCDSARVAIGKTRRNSGRAHDEVHREIQVLNADCIYICLDGSLHPAFQAEDPPAPMFQVMSA